jgi:DnaJ-class molecular chaperone
MGYDLIAQSGENFRNNIWWWRHLANYVLENCSDIMKEEEQVYWHSNDGQVVSEETAIKISQKLKSLIESGHTKEYEISNELINEALPDEKCELCNGTGMRHDNFVNGKCNSCLGKGHVRPTETWYSFSEDNVKEFAEFCEQSGGFEIC